MTVRFVNRGDILNVTNNTGATIASGTAFVRGGMLVVAIADIANGASGACYAEGVVTLPATTAEAWVDGLPLYWSVDTSKLTAVAGSHVFAGMAVGAKAAGATTANVKLSQGAPGTPATTT